ncbi:MAG: acyl-CoA dehydrogenase family protein [Gammaproteobacteria bacterium]
MDLQFTPEELAFRDEVRAFMRERLPEDIRQRMLGRGQPPKEDVVRWQRILNERGWAAPNWPVQWGGTDWTQVQRYLFWEELHAAPAPEPLSFNINMLGPVLIAIGSEEQKKRFLPRMRNLDDWWCQGFSEPEAGSDLAALKTFARREGDEYVLNGQKIWTTGAHQADWMFCLVRTSKEAKKQAGISFLLVDMKTPGITVRPLTALSGTHVFNEVFLDEVRVPVENRVGEENKGWSYAKFLLGNERAGIARVGISKERLVRAKALAGQLASGGRLLSEDPRFRERVAALEVRLMALEMTQLRLVSAHAGVEDGGNDPTASILKVRGSQMQQLAAELLTGLAGPHALPYHKAGGCAEDPLGGDPEWAGHAAPAYFFSRAYTLYGGSTEVQKNILARTIFGS